MISRVLFTLMVAAFRAAGAHAATIPFSFSNVNGSVDGEASGVVALPEGDGVFAADSIVVDSAPAALGYTTPFDALDLFSAMFENSVTVSGGQIVADMFGARRSPSSGGALALDDPGFGALLNRDFSGDAADGVLDAANATVTFGSGQTAPGAAPMAPVPLPAPAALLAAGLAGLRAASRRKA
mgnify:CR=1 FL=1